MDQVYPQITDNKIIIHGEDFVDAFVAMMEDMAEKQNNITTQPKETANEKG